MSRLKSRIVTTKERWRNVTGFEGLYEVSDRGRVKSLARRGRPDIILKGFRTRDGYRRVGLYKDGRSRNYRVARLVLLAFAGPPPSAAHEAHHLDIQRSHDALTNLRWETRSGNQRVRRDRNNRKLNDSQVRHLRQHHANRPMAEWATVLGVSVETIRRVIRGERYAEIV